MPRRRACGARPSTPDPVFTDTLELDLDDVVPSLAGPKRPQDRVPLDEAKAGFAAAMENEYNKAGRARQARARSRARTSTSATATS